MKLSPRLITLAAVVLAALFIAAAVQIGVRCSEIGNFDRNRAAIALVLALHDLDETLERSARPPLPIAIARETIGRSMDRVATTAAAHPSEAQLGPGWAATRRRWRSVKTRSEVKTQTVETSRDMADVYGSIAALATRRGLVVVAPGSVHSLGTLLAALLPLLDQRLAEARARNIAEMILTVAVVASVMATVAFLTLQALQLQARSRGSRLALEHQASHDALTGLPNRRSFADAIAETVAAWTSINDRTTWIFSIDLDYFKEVNDRYGHQVGDDFLIAAAQRLRNATPPGDLVARVGGDEFAVLLHHYDPDSAYAIEVAQSICDAFDEPIAVNGIQHRLAASVGLVAVDSLHETVDSLVRDADIAMYQAKDHGGDRVVVFDDLLRQAIVHRAQLAADLPDALRAHGEIGVVFQPIVALGSDRCYGFEALVRWKHPVHGLVDAGLLIDVAQDARLIDDLGRHIVHEVCRHLAEWRTAGVPLDALSLHFNISPMEAVHTDTFGSITHALEQYQIPPRTLVVELTETASMDSVEAADVFLKMLHAIDVRICLDDFGTGYSSLQHLNDFHVDVIKIDRSFVVSAAEDVKKLPIIAGIVALGTGLSAEIIAEGIETPEQLTIVEQLDCRLVQGYLFARPLAPAAACAFALERLAPPLASAGGFGEAETRRIHGT